MASRLIELVNKAIVKYGSILEAPENCDEFVEIRRISPDEIKPGMVEYEERVKGKFLKLAERERKILDLIDEGYTADMVANEMKLNVSTVRRTANRYGISDFGKYFRWYAERNGIKYYSTRRLDLERRQFKQADIKRVDLLKFQLPDRAHYCEAHNWHIKRRKKD